MRVVPEFALFRRGLIDGGDWRLLLGGLRGVDREAKR